MQELRRLRPVCAQALRFGNCSETGVYALESACNDMRAMKAETITAHAVIYLPPESKKTSAYQIEKELKKACQQKGLTLKEAEIIDQPAALKTGVSISLLGMSEEEQALAAADQDILLTKWAGMEGMLRIAREKEQELSRRFAPAFLRQVLSYQDQLDASRELGIAQAKGVSVLRQISEGGIFAALWKLTKESEIGFEIDLKKISLLQETIELCEHFRINPYQLSSAGSYLMLCEDAKPLAEALRQQGIVSAVIGRTKKGKEKLIQNGEDQRYLDRPVADEIYKIWK